MPAQAVILAGGSGTRLWPLVSDVPKPMAPVDGHPFMEYLIHQLVTAGIAEVVVCAGYMAETLQAHFGDGRQWGVRLTYSIEPQALGTGGALKLAEPLLVGDRWLVMNGDSLFDISLADLAAAHFRFGGPITLALSRAGDPGRYGGVTHDLDGSISAFVEKGDATTGMSAPDCINAGLYMIDRTTLAQIPADRPVSLEREVLPSFIGRGLSGALFEAAYFVDIGVPDDYRRAQLEREVFRRLRSPA